MVSAKVHKAKREEQASGSDEYVSLSSDISTALGILPGQQVRVEADSRAAAFTVGKIRHNQSDRDINIGKDGRRALAIDPGATVQLATTIPGAETLKTAKKSNDLAEKMRQEGSKCLVAAPHSGGIDRDTRPIAEHLYEEVSRFGVDASLYIMAGFGKASFKRWHIRSRNIHPASYPKFRDIARRRYEYTVSIHGHTEDHITVGGTASEGVRKAVRRGLENTLTKTTAGEVTVYHQHEKGKNSGHTGHNFVNWLRDRKKGGLQIELTEKSRNYPKMVAAGCREGFEKANII